jgi:two-component system response regulator WspF
MPKAAAAIGAASAILPLERIAPQLISRIALAPRD